MLKLSSIALLLSSAIPVMLQDPVQVTPLIASDSSLSTEFVPKVSLDGVRFAFIVNDKIVCELSSAQLELVEEFAMVRRDAAIGDPTMDLRLTEDDESWLFDRIPEKAGERFSCFFPEHGVENYALTSLNFLPTLVGGTPELVGILEAPRVAIGQNSTTRVAGLVFRDGKSTKRMAGRVPHLPASNAQTKAINAQIVRDLGDEAFVITATQGMLLSGPKVTGVICVVRYESSSETYLHGFQLEVDTVTRVEFQHRENGIQLFEEPDGPHGEYVNSTLHVLPDMDGNGGSELLFVSDGRSILFAIEENVDKPGFSIRTLRTISFGC